MHANPPPRSVYFTIQKAWQHSANDRRVRYELETGRGTHRLVARSPNTTCTSCKGSPRENEEARLGGNALKVVKTLLPYTP